MFSFWLEQTLIPALGKVVEKRYHPSFSARGGTLFRQKTLLTSLLMYNSREDLFFAQRMHGVVGVDTFGHTDTLHLESRVMKEYMVAFMWVRVR